MTTTPRIKCSCFSFQNGVQILIYNVHRLEERLSLCFIGVFQQTRTKFLLQGPALLDDGVPSVRTVDRLVRAVSRQLMIDSLDIAKLISDSAYCAQMGYTQETLPSLFIPNTYEVYWNMSADAFMKRMQKEHAAFWNNDRLKKAQHIGLTPEEVSTLASIVEEETANGPEKPMVAGLYINRLNKGMLLQADPTVKFGLQEFGLKRILFKHLEVDSPYNTYKHAGLPPGPIRIPSIQGLESVLNYTQHHYIYMCAKEDFSGTHNFAVTAAQHQANARRYQQALNRRKIK